MCSISVAPIPSMIRSPVASVEGLRHRPRQRLAGRHAAAQPGERGRLPGREHRPVRGGRGEQDRDTVLGDGVGEHVGRGTLDQQARGTGPQREDHLAAEPVREGERRAAEEEVVGRRLQHVPGEGVGDGQHVPVEVRGRLRHAGGAGGDGEQRDVVGGGLDGPERGPVPGRPRDQVVLAVTAVAHHPQLRDAGGDQVVGEPGVAERQAGPRDVADRAQLAGAQRRHRRHHHPARRQHAEPAGHQPRVVGAAQQHPVARHQAELLDQHVRDRVGPLAELAVRPLDARTEQAAAVRAVLGDGAREQDLRAVQPLPGSAAPAAGTAGRATAPGVAASPGRTCRRAPTGRVLPWPPARRPWRALPGRVDPVCRKRTLRVRAARRRPAARRAPRRPTAGTPRCPAVAG